MKQDELDATSKVFEDLREYIASESRLYGFLDVAEELAEQARGLANGNVQVGELTAPAPASIPTRALAEEIVAITSRLPSVGDDYDYETKYALACLLTNLVAAITEKIFRDYPGVIR